LSAIKLNASEASCCLRRAASNQPHSDKTSWSILA
jgi:hypothetical protein